MSSDVLQAKGDPSDQQAASESEQKVATSRRNPNYERQHAPDDECNECGGECCGG